MTFTLVKNTLGDFDLFVNGFHMPNFSVQRDYLKLQRWDEMGKVEIWDFNTFAGTNTRTTEQKEADVELIKAITKIFRGENNDSGSDTD